MYIYGYTIETMPYDHEHMPQVDKALIWYRF